MASLPPRPGHRLLRCPICRLGLKARGRALVCYSGHSFDLARDGYVNLLPGSRRRPAAGGDSSEQLGHRSAFLEASHFDYWLRVFDFGCSAKYSVGRMDTRNPRRTPITVGNWMFG